jgi:hypothetical protein
LLIVAGAAAALASPVKVEAIEGSDVKRVILDAKAAERLGIQTTSVKEEKVLFKTVVLGQVEDEPVAKPGTEVSTSGAAPGTAPKPMPLESKMRVLVLLDSEPSDDDQEDDVGDIDDEDSAEILAPDEDDDDEPLRAKRVVIASAADTDANTIYFKIPGGTHHKLTPGQRVGVRLVTPGSGEPRKVIPYSAVLYDASGDAWVYTSPGPLEFVRARVAIDKIDGDLAVLQEGPAAGTQVVTVGAAELFGAESGVGH